MVNIQYAIFNAQVGLAIEVHAFCWGRGEGNIQYSTINIQCSRGSLLIDVSLHPVHFLYDMIDQST
jgi:hypothetical protein